MDKNLFKRCIYKEIFEPYIKAKGKCNIFDIIWLIFICPESNALYLIRRKMFFESRGGVWRIFSRLIHSKLARRYGIYIAEGATVEEGLVLPHPIGIVITKCKIGKNFRIYQFCTVGIKHGDDYLDVPTIGDNVTMFAGSTVIGKIHVGDNVVIGANACLTKDAYRGIYVGVPAQQVLS